ncbi:hypothetical protein [Streptomyces sp. NPDC050534]|uniref:hypothetical protein n=1 Tax=Streptomyces sp. NPDC050534 TaxID=3365625 RepID=UPI0037A9688F
MTTSSRMVKALEWFHRAKTRATISRAARAIHRWYASAQVPTRPVRTWWPYAHCAAESAVPSDVPGWRAADVRG